MTLVASDLPKRLPLSAIADASGNATVRFTTGGRVAWEVSQITIECVPVTGAPIGSEAKLRVNDSLITPLVPTGDAAAGDPPLPVYPGDVVEIEWTGLTAQTQAKALVLYRPAPFGR